MFDLARLLVAYLGRELQDISEESEDDPVAMGYLRGASVAGRGQLYMAISLMPN